VVLVLNAGDLAAIVAALRATGFVELGERLNETLQQVLGPDAPNRESGAADNAQ
jgi:hypothetical protein